MSNSSTPLPYPLRKIKGGFSFETVHGIVYETKLADDSDYVSESSFVGPVVSFSIIHVTGQVREKDPRVEQTVVQALLQTFDEQPDVVINYICSLDDSQELARNRLFHWWYIKTGQERFIKLDFDDHHNRIHASALFRRDHPAETDIRESLTDLFAK